MVGRSPRSGGARHPLQELCVDRFIANDTAMGGSDRERTALVMGANYSGKSVYLKQVRPLSPEPTAGFSRTVP